MPSTDSYSVLTLGVDSHRCPLTKIKGEAHPERTGLRASNSNVTVTTVIDTNVWKFFELFQ